MTDFRRTSWSPVSEQDLILAADNGVLDEGVPGLELKATIPAGTAANRELARDLSSLAINGGTLIVGVRDVSDRDPESPASALDPIDHAGLPERIEQVALTRCDPPLHVTTRVIPSGASSRRGYVIVDIPASPLAPHMVDGRYWSRGEHTKRQLADAEVERLLRRRDDLDRSSEIDLDAYTARDPYTLPDRPRRLGHQFLVGVPLQASNTMLLDAITGDDWVWVTARYQVGPGTGGWHPSPHDLTRRDRRDDGWALTTHHLTTGRTLTVDAVESSLFEIEMTEAGAVRLYSGGVTGFHTSQADDPEDHILFDVAVVGNTRHFVHMLGAVADQTGYRGLWALGLALIGVGNAVPYSIAQNWLVHDPPRRSDGSYREFARASTAQLDAAPGTVTDRLVGRFLRSVRVADHPMVAPYLADPLEDAEI